jgi:hypothetical protein
LKHKPDKYEYKVNNLFSHLIYKRLNYKKIKKEWPINKVAKEVNENIFQFIEAAEKNLLCDEITMYKKQLESCNAIKYNHFTCTTSDATGKATNLSTARGPTSFKRYH